MRFALIAPVARAGSSVKSKQPLATIFAVAEEIGPLKISGPRSPIASRYREVVGADYIPCTQDCDALLNIGCIV